MSDTAPHIPLVRFCGASKRFDDGTRAVDDVCLDMPSGQFCALVGASGAGKSTLLRMINGMVAPTGGRVEFDGLPVTRANLRRIQPQIAMIHQQFNLVPRASVLDNVLSGALPTVSTIAAMLHVFPTTLRRKACRLLDDVGLTGQHLYRRAMQLSGGQQQRVAIARAFILDPALVLADEPVASLDPATSRTILTLLKQASRQRGTAVLCSLHQVDLAVEYADRIVGMRRGCVVFDGPPSAFDVRWQDEIYRDVPPTAVQTPEIRHDGAALGAASGSMGG